MDIDIDIYIKCPVSSRAVSVSLKRKGPGQKVGGVGELGSRKDSADAALGGGAGGGGGQRERKNTQEHARNTQERHPPVGGEGGGGGHLPHDHLPHHLHPNTQQFPQHCQNTTLQQKQQQQQAAHLAQVCLHLCV
jgi:hypothetical protein